MSQVIPPVICISTEKFDSLFLRNKELTKHTLWSLWRKIQIWTSGQQTNPNPDWSCRNLTFSFHREWRIKLVFLTEMKWLRWDIATWTTHRMYVQTTVGENMSGCQHDGFDRINFQRKISIHLTTRYWCWYRFQPVAILAGVTQSERPKIQCKI